MPPAAVEIRDWAWRYSGRAGWALRGVDLRIGPGERVLLLGPSGAGKSTLLAALAGLLDRGAGDAAGQVLVDGHPPAQVRRQVGIVFQDPETQLVMARAGDDVAFGLENRGTPVAEIWPRVRDALARVRFDYPLDHSTAALSGGEKQRLVLAGALALRPSLLLLDEPTASLDPDSAANIRAALRDLVADRGITMVVVEHRIAEMRDLVDRVVVLAAGAGVIADGTPAEVLDGPTGDRLADSGVWVPGRPLPAPPRPAAVGGALLRAERVSYRHHNQAVDALPVTDIQLSGTKTTTVTGPNGSGKSTLALLLAGLRAPVSGRVVGTQELAGVDCAVPPHRWSAAALVRRIGTVFQNPEHQFLTGSVIRELLLSPLRAGMTEKQASKRAGELMERLRLSHLAEANPFTLSGGEKRRLSVATALITSPRVLVLDEPTFGQDRRTWIELVQLLAVQRDDGRALCLITHDAELVTALADDVLQLRRTTQAAVP